MLTCKMKCKKIHYERPCARLQPATCSSSESQALKLTCQGTKCVRAEPVRMCNVSGRRWITWSQTAASTLSMAAGECWDADWPAVHLGQTEVFFTHAEGKRKHTTVTDKSQTEASLLFICRQIESAWAALFIPRNKPFQHVFIWHELA